jgi:hypothetical protein
VDGELVALAATAGSALVGAIATDAWQLARSGFGRLFGRYDRRRQEIIEAAMDHDARAIEQAENAHRDSRRTRVAAQWQARLRDLLVEYPDIADYLRPLVAQVNAAGPGSQPRPTQDPVRRAPRPEFSVVLRGYERAAVYKLIARVHEALRTGQPPPARSLAVVLRGFDREEVDEYVEELLRQFP